MIPVGTRVKILVGEQVGEYTTVIGHKYGMYNLTELYYDETNLAFFQTVNLKWLMTILIHM